MPTLYLMRHAKSSWDDPALDDHERPLNARGERAAAKMACVVAGLEPSPQLVLSSTAVRARDTAAAVVAALEQPTPLETDDRVYGADRMELAARLRELPDTYDCVLVVGHNPGMEDLVGWLTGRDVTMPTAAVAQLGFTGGWSDLSGHVCWLTAFLTPRQPSP